MSEINIYVCTVLCRNQKWEMKIIIYGKTNKQTKQPANSIRITLLGGALWKKTICFNNWSQPNHKSSLLNHDLIFKIKEPKQQFLWPPPPSFLLLVALFFMNSSSHLFLVVASQTRKSGSIFLSSWLPQLLQLRSKTTSNENPTPACVLTTLGCTFMERHCSGKKSVLLCLWLLHRGEIVSWLTRKAKLKVHQRPYPLHKWILSSDSILSAFMFVVIFVCLFLSPVFCFRSWPQTLLCSRGSP